MPAPPSRSPAKRGRPAQAADRRAAARARARRRLRLGDRRPLRRDRGRLRPAGPGVGGAAGQRPDRRASRSPRTSTVAAGQTLFSHRRRRPTAARSRQAQARLASARLEVEKLKAAYAAGGVRGRDRPRRARDGPDPGRRASRRCSKSGVVSQAAADDSALKLQQARGALAKAESAGAGGQGGAGRRSRHRDRPPPAGARRRSPRCTRPSSTSRAPRSSRPADGVVSQTDRLQAGPVRDARRAGAQPRRHRRQLDRGELQGDRPHPHERRASRSRSTLDTYPDAAARRATVGSIGAGTGSEFALLPAQNATGNWVKVVQRVPVRIELDAGQDVPPLRAGMSASGRGRHRPRPRPAARACRGARRRSASAAAAVAATAATRDERRGHGRGAPRRRSRTRG